MSGYFSEIISGGKSLVVGMSITLKEFFKPKVTLQYPHQTVKMAERFRGHIELIENESGEPNCVACGMCQRACPSGCISLTSKSVEIEVEGKTKKKKVLTSYDLNFTTCSLCGSCVESCNFDAICYSKEYNLASTRKEDFHFDLLKRLKERNS
ncbi:MAG: NADH-quinone oxidoreductase subunit I [Desulfobulbaceae bacterium]|uniref:NADH-quinone oxidoreductase subunit I n=1 Tax=Candidatus Desulfatifera sulfidica TaxID=2841691 RepID=A0A8J6N7V8_9BACT|nr:NADH-quinone oxidoreductase subunit I [Candidatus Desulfatifera sulfidica]